MRTTPTTSRSALLSGVVMAGLLVAACGDDDAAEAVIDPGDGGDYTVELDPADFVDGVDNPFLPLVPGSRWVYEGMDDGEEERVEVEVTSDRREILGISAVVVRDTVFVDGEMVEDTFDWFAQDKEGNVWYLGEDSREFENGQAVNAAGSWEAGIDGALPGIVMPADPRVGDAYRQEYYEGEAEDMAEVISLEADTLVTRDWNPLEPDVIEEKTYERGTGLVGEEKVAGGNGTVELLEYTPGA